jgi:cysteine synthase A
VEPCGSVKDRIDLSIIRATEKAGKLNKETILVEPINGNTSIDLAFAAAVCGYKLKLVMPYTMSNRTANFTESI